MTGTLIYLSIYLSLSIYNTFIYKYIQDTDLREERQDGDTGVSADDGNVDFRRRFAERLGQESVGAANLKKKMLTPTHLDRIRG